MSTLERVNPEELLENPFSLIGKDWTLITAGNSVKHYNTMTASWGGLGVLWNKNVATVYVRPQRYTYEFMEEENFFTLSFFGESWRKALNFCGSKSGREFDKAAECGLTPSPLDGGIAFAEARLALTCKKIYWSDILPANFMDPSIDQTNYPGRDYHRMYVGEIMNAYLQK